MPLQSIMKTLYICVHTALWMQTLSKVLVVLASLVAKEQPGVLTSSCPLLWNGIGTGMCL